MTKQQYPSPEDHPVFKKHWDKLIDEVAARENFSNGHLSLLKVLCDLYVDYEQMNSAINELGWFYTPNSQSGLRPRPEVAQRTRIREEIRNYSRMLGIIMKPSKDKPPSEEDNSWTD